MKKDIHFFFCNNKRILRVVSETFESLESAQIAAYWMLQGYEKVAGKKASVVAVVPAEWREISADDFIKNDETEWPALHSISQDSCRFICEYYEERARFFDIHPDVPVGSEQDKKLMKLYERKKAYQGAVMLFRDGDNYHVYYQDANTLLLCIDHQMDGMQAQVGDVTFPAADLENNMHALTSAGYRVAIEDDIIIKK